MSPGEPHLILSLAGEVSQLCVGEVPDSQLVGVAILPLLAACHVVLVMAHLYLSSTREVEPFHLRKYNNYGYGLMFS